MTVNEFRAAVAAGKFKHMGLKESLLMVGAGLGVEFESVTDEKIEPIVAEREVVTERRARAEPRDPSAPPRGSSRSSSTRAWVDDTRARGEKMKRKAGISDWKAGNVSYNPRRTFSGVSSARPGICSGGSVRDEHRAAANRMAPRLYRTSNVGALRLAKQQVTE